MSKSTGGCLCGNVRYAFDHDPEFVGHCYCRDCQLATGSAFTTILAVPNEKLQIDGEVRAFTVKAASDREVTRLFCPNCGTPLFTRAEMNPSQTFVKCTTLDEPAAFTPTMTCWTSGAQPWAPLPENTVNFEANPG